MSRPRVMVIGLDGGTLTLIRPWADAGELPNIAHLLRSGASGTLRSTNPPLTPVAWSSFLTGCGPGKHGIYGFLGIDRDYHTSFLSGGSLTIPGFADIASAAGLRVGLLNVPWTWPPPPVNGFCLSGMDAPFAGPGIAHPSGLFEEVVGQLGGYFQWFVPYRKRGYALDLLDEQIDRLADAALYLLEHYPVDLFAMVFGSTDQVQHSCWRERAVESRDGRRVDDLVLYTYRRADAQIGRIIERCAGDDTTVILMSDHGAGPCLGGINLDLWLAEHGWLSLSPVAGGLAQRLRRATLRFGARALPLGLRRMLRPRLTHRRRGMMTEFLSKRVDWPATRAFCWSDYGNISLNLAGRFAEGTVTESEREGLLAEIAGELAGLTHPETGERVMSAPLRAEETWHGPRTGAAPDLLAVVRDYRYSILSDFTPGGPLPGRTDRAVFGPSRLEGTHRLHGVFSAAGPGIRPGFIAGGLRIQDVAPTLLHLLGLPVPSWMDGRVASQLFTREALAARPPVRRDAELVDARLRRGYDGEEQEQVARMLRGLGYL